MKISFISRLIRLLRKCFSIVNCHSFSFELEDFRFIGLGFTID
jgi:hypothetical protein